MSGMNGMKGARDSLDGSNGYAVRQDENTGLKALFEKVFFDVPYSPAAVEALRRIEVRLGEADVSDSTPATPAVETALPGTLETGAGPFRDDPRTVLLYRGESGVGKTRIFRRFRAHAEERKIPVYEIHCHDVDGIPFKPFLRVIREILRDFEFDQFLREKYRPGLAALLPEIFRKDGTVRQSETSEGSDLSPLDRGVEKVWEEDKLRIFDGITQLLFEITALRPVVILVHDLNWGDQATIELLRYIGRNIQLRNSRFKEWRTRGVSPPGGDEWVPGEEGLEDPERLDLAPSAGRFPHVGLGRSRGAAGTGGATTTPGRGAPPERVENRPVRLMVLANYQGAASREDYLERALRSLGEESFAYHGEIRRLDREDTRDFIERSLSRDPGATGMDLDPEAVASIHEWSEGYPSYIQELLRLLVEHGREDGRITPSLVEEIMGPSSREDPGAAGEADHQEASRESESESARESAADSESEEGSAPADPAPVSRASRRHEILRRRLRDTRSEELSVLQALALARKPMTVPHLSRVVNLAPESLQAVLTGLQERGFLERVGQLFPRGEEEDGYYFCVGDYPHVVSETITEAENRASLHQRIGDEIPDQTPGGGEKNYEIFYHLRRGLDVRSAVPFGLLAARRFARSFSVKKAILLLEDLLTILDGDGDRETRLQILEQMALYHLPLKDFSRAEEALNQILEDGGPELEGDRRAELLIQLGRTHQLSGDTQRALKVLTRAFKHIRDIHSPLGIRWHLATARVRRSREDIKRAVNLCLKGIKLCQKSQTQAAREERASGPSPVLREQSELYQLLARTFTVRGDSAHAVENFRKSLEGFEALGDQAAAARVLDDLGTVYLERGSYFRAARYFYRALEMKRRNGDIAGLCVSYDQLGQIYLRTGDELKTLAHLSHSIQLKEKTGDLEGLNPTLRVMGDVYFRLGRYQRAIRYYLQEIQNSQLLKDTKGLVEGFTSLGWVYHEIGDVKKVENFTRQVSILASEFKLRPQEAGGARLQGVHETLKRDWDAAEAQLKTALEIYAKLGNRRQEAMVLLDQADVKYERESHDEALKLASKAMALAEQLQDLDLQVRAQVIKGNVFRFLRGGNIEKARDHLRRALELGDNLNDIHRLFEIHYSLAKVYHYGREFVEAGNFYGKAEAILRRVADELADDLGAKYMEDRRRKIFLEDADRFRKEVQGRADTEGGVSRESVGTALRSQDRPVGLADYQALNARILRVHSAQQLPEFHDVALRESMDLVKAQRGFILRVRNRQYARVACEGFGSDADDNPEYPSAQSLAEEAIRKGKSLLITGSAEREKEERILQSGGLFKRTLLVAPLKTAERIFGGVYLDRPVSLGGFNATDRAVLETLAEHLGVTLDGRRRLELSVREPLTGLYTTTYFLERLEEYYRLTNLHGRPFFLMGFYLPTLEASLSDEARLVGEQLSMELREELPSRALASWGSPILAILVSDMDLPSTDRLAQRISARLIGIVNSRVAHEILAPEARLPSGVSLYHELRRKLLPDESDQHTLIEIRQLLSRDITLKDAKRILERHIIENTLRKTGGNITHAAKELGIHRPQLSSLLKKHDLKRERFESGVEELELETTERWSAGRTEPGKSSDKSPPSPSP